MIDSHTVSSSSYSPRRHSNYNNSEKKTTRHHNHDQLSLEQHLFHLLKQHHVRNPTTKEFKECWAFAKALQPIYTSSSIQVILDVAGGHGALGAMLLILFPTATHAVVIDPAASTLEAEQQQTYTGVQQAWKDFLTGPSHKEDMRLTYRSECLLSALPNILQTLTSSRPMHDENNNNNNTNRMIHHPSHILVVACHACQHLSEATIQIAYSYGVHVAVMPCCQKDHIGSFKAFAKTNHLPLATVMDILLAGKCQSWMIQQDISQAIDDALSLSSSSSSTSSSSSSRQHFTYQVKMRTIDSSITPQNRLILCKVQYHNGYGSNSSSCRSSSDKFDVIQSLDMKYIIAHRKLQSAYKRAHGSRVKIKKAREKQDSEALLCKPIQELVAKTYEHRVTETNVEIDCPVINYRASFQFSPIIASVFILGLILGSILSALVFYFVYSTV